MAIITAIENEQTDYLKSRGLFTSIVPKLSFCSCIIDKTVIWYGSVNLLGYPAEEDNVIRIADIKLANELLNVIYNCKK